MRWADSIRMFFSKLLGEEADDSVWIPFTQDRDSWHRLEDDYVNFCLSRLAADD